MTLSEGRRIALAVDVNWYKAAEGHGMLKNGPLQGITQDNPTDLLIGTIQSSNDMNGLWIKPSDLNSAFPKASMLVPWRFIVGAMLMDADEEKKLTGFAPKSD